ncbi:MAG: purine-nucleoside phosphorylase [Bacteroidetes bacterium]|nr:purine-nucleoside phosphorylase [Bacteroidota bacterium]MDA0873544.1 purine-nucleoside phosphorylase [Bacteroidota bacterium]
MDRQDTHVDAVRQAAAFLRQRLDELPDLGIILGTGLDGLSRIIEVHDQIPYEEIEGFPVSTVQSHAGLLIKGTLAGRPVLALKGRAHIYEGYSAKQVTLPVRVLGELGVRTLVISNACGGLLPQHRAGDIMLIEDHINLMSHNPLEGPNHDSWGPRFPDMSDPYPAPLRRKARQAAEALGVSMHEGVYAAVVGPNLETRAEYRMLQRMGASVIGMSTVPEVLAANHMGIKVLAFSVITDECDPNNLLPISIDDVLAAAARASDLLCRLLEAVVPTL